jgi:hypothetical protein
MVNLTLAATHPTVGVELPDMPTPGIEGAFHHGVRRDGTPRRNREGTPTGRSPTTGL